MKKFFTLLFLLLIVASTLIISDATLVQETVISTEKELETSLTWFANLLYN